MKIQLWSVGKVHDNYVKEGIEDFTKRISKYCPVEWKLFSPAKQTTSSLTDVGKGTTFHIFIPEHQ